MANDKEPSLPRGMSLEKSHEMRMDNANIALQEQVKKLTMELK